jgi:hypothetical protein
VDTNSTSVKILKTRKLKNKNKSNQSVNRISNLRRIMFGQHQKRVYEANTRLYSKKYSPCLVARDYGGISAFTKNGLRETPLFGVTTDLAASLVLIDMNAEKVIHKFYEYHEAWINNFEFNESNTRIYSTCSDNHINALDIESQKVYSMDVGVVPDGTCSVGDNEVYFTTSDGTCCLWDYRSSTHNVVADTKTLSCDLKLITSDILFIADAAGAMWWWDLKMLKPLMRVISDTVSTSLDFQNHSILMNTRESLWYLPNIDVTIPHSDKIAEYPGVVELDLNYNMLSCKNASLSKDGNFAFVGWDRNFAIVWDISKKSTVTSISVPSQTPISKTHILENGKLCITFESSLVCYGIHNTPLRKVVDINSDIMQEGIDTTQDATLIPIEFDDLDVARISVCTYPEGYIDQDVYVCMTCREERDERAGFCAGCVVHCHDGHRVAKLDLKRTFCCDCGTSKFTHPCQFETDKRDLNIENEYNHNFDGKYCICDGPVELPMMMCFGCHDWFHGKCVGLFDEEEVELNSLQYYCVNCVDRVPPSSTVFEQNQPKSGVVVREEVNFGDTVSEIKLLRDDPVNGEMKNAITLMMQEMLQNGHELLDVNSLIMETVRIYKEYEVKKAAEKLEKEKNVKSEDKEPPNKK